ncbi:MAG: hypothetical protein RMI89_05355 [Gloeomargarita sp. SKYBB_i_bin120]|nr:hypothetical protein [Gloeomargarita sp. SKYB120]MDW8177951.1 hypothetical protein [Gloeomargarita sp. SKYBB_i_bin120]
MVNFLLGLLVGVIGLLWMWQRYQRVRSQWQKRLQQSEETTQSYQQERDALIRQYQELTQRLQALDEAYQAAVQRVKELEQENQRYKQQVQRLETDHRIAIQRVQVLEAENQQLQTDCTDFQKYAQAIEATHQQTQADYQDAINQIQVLETQKRQLQQRVDQLLECINQPTCRPASYCFSRHPDEFPYCCHL